VETLYLATLLGSLPGIVSFVLFGSPVSIATETGTIGLYLWALLTSAVVFAVSIAAYKYCRLRRGEKEEDGLQRGE
jgi:uncharacterized membrane protein YdjX (TVP38/TMEM64 family)